MAKTNMIFIGWNRAARGREQQALQLFQHSMGLYEKWKAGGRIENYEAVVLGAHGGDSNGYIVLRGDHDKLHGLRNTEEFVQLIVRGNIDLEGFGVLDGYTGGELMNLMQLWGKAISA